MAFSKEVLKKLNQPLDKNLVKPPTPQIKGSYLEAWVVINALNEIFGNGGWSRKTHMLRQSHTPLKSRSSSGKEVWLVTYEAIVEISVGDVCKQGVGVGIGQMGNLGNAVDLAAKTAETIGMKRAAMTFGHPLGLALYDEDQTNVADLSLMHGDELLEFLEKSLIEVEDIDDLKQIFKEHGERIPSKNKQDLRGKFKERLVAASAPAKDNVEIIEDLPEDFIEATIDLMNTAGTESDVEHIAKEAISRATAAQIFPADIEEIRAARDRRVFDLKGIEK